MVKKSKTLPEVNTGVVFLFVKDGKILIEERPETDEDFGGLPSIPGGKIKFRQGELAEEALIREVKEELGNSVVVDKYIDLGEFFLISKSGKIQRPRAFLIKEFRGKPKNIIPGKGVHKWVSINDYDKELPLAASKLVIERALKVLSEEGN